MKRIHCERAQSSVVPKSMRVLLIFLGFLLVPTATRAQQEPPLLVVVGPATAPRSQAAALPSGSVAEEGSKWNTEPRHHAFAPGWLSLGVSVLVGTRPRAAGIDATLLGGFDVGFRLDEHIAIGTRRWHASGNGAFASVGTSPYLELSVRPWERLDLYTQLGTALGVLVPIQRGDAGLELAPFATAGGRIYLADFLSIAIEGSMHVPLASGLVADRVTLPPLSIHLSGGLAVAFHLS